MSDLHVKVWLGKVENLAKNVLLGTPFIYRFTCRIFLREGKVIPEYSGPKLILANQFNQSKQLLSNLEPSNHAFALYETIVAKQGILQSYNETNVTATIPIECLSLPGPEQLTQQYSHLYVAPRIIGTSKDRAFGISISNSLKIVIAAKTNCRGKSSHNTHSDS